jgi:hypothetical protein
MRCQDSRGTIEVVISHGWPGSVVEFLDVIGPADRSGRPWRRSSGHFAAMEEPDVFVADLRVFSCKLV